MADKWLCFDFDGVIASYDGWKGFDVLGEPNLEVIKAMQTLNNKGYRITIFTTRMDTPVLRKWLYDNLVPYDSVNSNSHNPTHTSQKPIYHAVIDDRAVCYDGQPSDYLIHEILKLVDKAI